MNFTCISSAITNTKNYTATFEHQSVQLDLESFAWYGTLDESGAQIPSFAPAVMRVLDEVCMYVCMYICVPVWGGVVYFIYRMSYFHISTLMLRSR